MESVIKYFLRSQQQLTIRKSRFLLIDRHNKKKLIKIHFIFILSTMFSSAFLFECAMEAKSQRELSSL